MRKLFLFWVLWAIVWVLAIKLLVGLGLTSYQSTGWIIIGAIIDIIAAVIFSLHPTLRVVGVLIFTMALIFNFGLVMVICYVLSMLLLYVTYHMVH